MEPVLSFHSVSFSYHSIKGETPAVANLSFSVNPGEFTVLIGPSGCGKSTLLSLACGLLKPEAGSVCLNSEKIQIGYMFQRDHLFEWQTLYQNVMLGPKLHHRETPEVVRRVKQMIELYGLKDFAESPPSALSGGMRQRAALIRTLAVEPGLLILDEPFSALDYQTRLEVADDITAIIRQSGKTVLMVTHDLSEAVSIADRILILSQRPCTLKADVPIQFPDQIVRPALRRQNPYFSQMFHLVWKELKNEHGNS